MAGDLGPLLDVVVRQREPARSAVSPVPHERVGGRLALAGALLLTELLRPPLATPGHQPRHVVPHRVVHAGGVLVASSFHGGVTYPAPVVLDPERRGELQAAKLRALVGGAGEATTFPGGAGRVDGTTGWVLAASDPARALGPALVWAHRHGVADLHVLVDGDDADTAGALARRAAEFADPPTVERIDGRTRHRAEPSPPPHLDAPAPAAAAEFVRALRAAGADPVVERGVVVGEINGLEIARVITDDDGAYLEVGVGKHDRHAQALVHGGRPTAEALAAAVEFVARHRRIDAEPHPLNRLARERWLRALVVARPQLVGATSLRPVSSPVARDDLRVAAPAPAFGAGADGRPVVVVCSTGIDLDLVPAAADARRSLDPDARLVLVVPPRDDHPITRRLAAALRRPAEIRTVELEPDRA